jgi:mannose-1-phosphate guanylyltransferase
LQDTLRRLDGLPLGAPIVVSNQEYRFITAEQLRELGIANWTLLLEPVGRNTAPALTAAALYASRDGADPVLLATPADHHVRDAAAFRQAVLRGLTEAEAGTIVTFGIVADRPETGYGYIEVGAGDTATGAPRDHQRFPREARCRHRRCLCGRRAALLEQRHLPAACLGLAQGHRPFRPRNACRLPRTP